MKQREFDLVVFGATAFTGKEAVAYLKKRLSPSVCWAVSARNEEKLKATLAYAECPSLPRFVIDQADQDAVGKLVARSRVVLAYAGPFAFYGESIVRACAKHGTHYLDITGETLWVRQMMNKYEADAKKSGAVILPFSGFDSIPSDLGAFRALEKARSKNKEVDQIVSIVSIKGGINGGTYATMLDFMENPVFKNFKDPLLLVSHQGRSAFPAGLSDQKWPAKCQAIQKWGAPFFMAQINSRTVYRTFELKKIKNPPPYFERLNDRNFFRAFSTSLGMEALDRLGSYKLGRDLLKKVGPKPGQGPSIKSQTEGFFNMVFYGLSGNQISSQVEMSFQGDPGNKATIVLSCEAAITLLEKEQREVAPPGGFWTPATALLPEILGNLTRAGVTWKEQ